MTTLQLPITKEQFLSFTFRNVSQVYRGKQNCCRCGCGGTYTSTTFAKDVRSPIDDHKVHLALKRAQKLVQEGAEVDFDAEYVEVTTGKDRTLTFYFEV